MRFMNTAIILLLAMFFATLIACSGSIGDDCSSDSQCPPGSYCDKTMPGGMCTKGPCRPEGCPEDSVCVEFYNGQTFCMAGCNDSDDCRDGYTCVKDVGRFPFCSVVEE